MIYLANPSTARVREAIGAGLLGQMVTPEQGNRIVPGAAWALDNGCFSGAWSPQRYFDTLDRYAPVARECLFAVVPDVVADATATDSLWTKWHLGLLRRGFRAAYVLQDGTRTGSATGTVRSDGVREGQAAMAWEVPTGANWHRSPETARCACSHLVADHGLVRGRYVGACTWERCGCRRPW